MLRYFDEEEEALYGSKASHDCIVLHYEGANLLLSLPTHLPAEERFTVWLLLLLFKLFWKAFRSPDE